MAEITLPFWEDLSEKEQNSLKNSWILKKYEKGNFITSGEKDCLGFVFVQSGVLRVFITSETGREITLYKLKAGEMCLFSARCAFKDLSFSIQLEACEECKVCVIPSGVFQSIIQENAKVSAAVNKVMAERFSSVMLLLEEILFKGFDKRLKEYLLRQKEVTGSGTLRITHEQIAKDLNSAREVVSRMLSHMADEGLVILKRGEITLTVF